MLNVVQTRLPGAFTCSIVNIQDQVPPRRRTEVIGSLGSSGFIGTILGTNLGDLIFQLWPGGQTPFLVTFGTTLLGGILHTLLVLELTREEHHEAPPEFVGPLKLLFHYWPGPVLLVSMAMGTVTTLPRLWHLVVPRSFHCLPSLLVARRMVAAW